jgi:hypothetical protein
MRLDDSRLEAMRALLAKHEAEQQGRVGVLRALWRALRAVVR